MFTIGASGASHIWRKNVQWGLVWRLAPAGIAGGIIGALTVSYLPVAIMKPIVLRSPRLDPAIDRIMICGSAGVLHDLKAIALQAGFVEGSNHQPGTFVVERAFAA